MTATDQAARAAILQLTQRLNELTDLLQQAARENRRLLRLVSHGGQQPKARVFHTAQAANDFIVGQLAPNRECGWCTPSTNIARPRPGIRDLNPEATS
ncbi:hypothetical protein [Streptomyces venezuelae]|uniref:Uncharacterized protein n=1 Tax=Streptomyces venezuelae TaxID=54571 RepID=A0A5P2B7N0_STRVZ|nr:hypothetical protein [Streptomyces venezuelae]QES25900.1 hypothetical protein DEJ47_05000 [Streptomyces venezuelae]